MVQHVVMWRLSDKTKTFYIKGHLESLKGTISGLIDLKVGINFNSSDAAFDLVLITSHKSKDDLKEYQNNPAHILVVNKIKDYLCERNVVDFII